MGKRNRVFQGAAFGASWLHLIQLDLSSAPSSASYDESDKFATGSIEAFASTLFHYTSFGEKRKPKTYLGQKEDARDQSQAPEELVGGTLHGTILHSQRGLLRTLGISVSKQESTTH